jgi:hypothetical protein
LELNPGHLLNFIQVSEAIFGEQSDFKPKNNFKLRFGNPSHFPSFGTGHKSSICSPSNGGKY